MWLNSAHQFHGGVVLKRQIGATALSASRNGGFGNIDVRRDVTPATTAKGPFSTPNVLGRIDRSSEEPSLWLLAEREAIGQGFSCPGAAGAPPKTSLGSQPRRRA